MLHVVLISTYELGHQPFGLASPAAWLRNAGHEVVSLDLAVQSFEDQATQQAIRAADVIAFYVPMHTATRITTTLLPRVRAANPQAHLCCYGLYAPLNEALLHELGVGTILGGEFEQGLVDLVQHLSADQAEQPDRSTPPISLAKQDFVQPDRGGLPALNAYAFLQLEATTRTVGYTEATRGCKHLCRHCPIVPVYGGQFRVVQREVVLADIRQQVAAGAQHITFGDPDFLNGPRHALAIVEALHAEFPHVTYDATIKVEHLLRQAALLPRLRETGCILITSAVEAVDERILAIFDKRHSMADFVQAVELLRDAGIALNPTFVAFTPWTTRQGYIRWLKSIAELDLIEHVAPVQYAIRLLIPAGSRLLELDDVQKLVQPFDREALVYPWAHPDQTMDQLYEDVRHFVQRAARRQSRQAIFEQVWALAHGQTPRHVTHKGQAAARAMVPRKPIPQLSEPWYC